MKRVLALILAMAVLLTGCAKTSAPSVSTETHDEVAESFAPSDDLQETSDTSAEETGPEVTITEFKKIVPEFNSLDDPELLRYVEDNLYTELVSDLSSEEYFIENISAVYLSEEYLEELEYNSKSNIYFGYTLSELDEAFQGTRYVFTLGENNETIVEAFEAYDDTYRQVIKNVAIGTGVIVICVTVSVVSAGAGAPAVSIIFATAAKDGATMALSSAALTGVTSSVITGIQTKDMEQALKSGLLTGSESFKWGAITGVITGGVTEGVKYAKAMKALKGAALNGLTMQQAAAIQMETGFPIDIIKQFHSMDEYQVYKNAGLTAKMVNGKLALVKEIDLTFKVEMPDGKVLTNLERMAEGYAPIDPITGKAYQLHHIGQKADATLAVLTEAEHKGNAAILNIHGKESEIDRVAFKETREAFWEAYAAAFA